MTRGVLTWAGAVIAAGSAIWLVGYFAMAGFQPADTVGLIGAVVGIAGVVLAVAGRVTGQRGGQSVTGSGIDGGLAQVRGGKNVTIHHRGRHSGAGVPPAPVPPAPVEGGQSVTGSQIAGPVDQVDGARGDVELREEP